MAQALNESKNAKNNKKKRKKKKRRSQAPVALIYFVTLLMFLGVFGVFAKVIVDKLTTDDTEEVDYSNTYIDSYNTLYARVTNKGTLCDMTVLRICPEQGKILVIPISAYTVSTEDGVTMREVYEDGGIRKLQTAVNTTFGISTDYYATVLNQAFEDIADIIGGFAYTPEEELYYLSPGTNDDISLRANEQVSLTGRQIRLICQTQVFSKGRQGNTEFLGLAMVNLINSAFEQVEITSNSLDILYNKISSNTTDLSENAYKQQKVYIKAMLEKQLQPAYSMVPEGQWTDEKHFVVSSDFKQKLYDEMEATKSEQKSGNISED